MFKKVIILKKTPKKCVVHTRANVFELMRSWFHIALLRRNASLKDIFPLVSYIVVLVNQYKLEEDFDPICIYVFSNCIQNRKILVSDVYNRLWTKYLPVDNII